MKKLLSFLLAFSLVVTALAVPAAADAAFSDLGADHWAYAQVSRLVSDGTINGYADGTFKPQGTVTRAEFVKMLGKSPVKREADFADVPASHWAYEYVMYSGLEGDNANNFMPDTAITRDDVANLLYKRYAGGAVAVAPYSITSQGTNPTAVAWVYNSGLMIGDDMLTLRLADTLTRAEAAVLIVRAKDLDPNAKRSFIDNFNDEVYKNVYEASNLFDSAYAADENITYEELSAAALRFQYKYRNPALNYQYEKKYDGKYAAHWAIMCAYALDEKGIEASQAEAQKYATVEDAIAMLSYCAKRNEYVLSNVVAADGRTYPEVTVKDAKSEYASNLSYAYNFGISLYSDAKINPTKLITKMELSCILMQYSLVYGAQVAYSCGYNAAYVPLTARLSSESYPANIADYNAIVNEIPNYVYEAPFAEGKEIELTPKQYADHLAMHSLMYVTPFIYMSSEAYDKGADIYITMYSSMAVRLKGSSSVFRVKFDINKTFDGMKLSDIIPLADGVEDRALSVGDSFYADVATNQPLMSAYIDYTLFTLEKLIN